MPEHYGGLQAKLQAKELETLQLQKQVQDLQALMATMQLQGSGPDVQLQVAQLQAQNQALQLENVELRLLATRLLDENYALQQVHIVAERYSCRHK